MSFLSPLKLFHFYFCAGFFQGSNELFCIVFATRFLDCGRSAVYHVLCFLEAKARSFSYYFDNFDLFCAGSFQNYVKFCFFFRSSSAVASSRSSSNRYPVSYTQLDVYKRQASYPAQA